MAEDSTRHDARSAALRALGIDPSTVVFPAVGVDAPGDDQAPPRPAKGQLDDDEWAIISPYLPDESPQAQALANRAFVDAVLWMQARSAHWTQIADQRGEAVRKRFARWAHTGVWQRLYDDVVQVGGLGGERQAQLAALAKRARILQSRTLAARARRRGAR